MQKIPTYFFAEHPDLSGAGFIISSIAPCYVGKVYKFNNEEDFNLFVSRPKTPFKEIPGYRMAIQYFGTMGEGEVKQDPDDLEVALIQMVGFYLEKKIALNEKYYKRYKL